MSELRRFRAQDLFSFNPINLDRLTETYNLSFYLSYMATWPDLFLVQHSPTSTGFSFTEKLKNLSMDSTSRPREGRMIGYLMGKLEGRGTDWHSHVTAITVSPEYRRLGIAKGMMDGFELSSDLCFSAVTNRLMSRHRGYFVDLFVRTTNHIAIGMYKQFGYSVYRRVRGYYHGGLTGNKHEDEDAFGILQILSVLIYRHEEAFETGQVKTKYKRERGELPCFT